MWLTNLENLLILIFIKICGTSYNLAVNIDVIPEPADQLNDLIVEPFITKFNIDTVKTITEPSCDTSVYLTIVVHSHPEHRSLRDTLRQTWAAKQKWVQTRTVFVLGKPKEPSLQIAIEDEATERQDILQGDFIDSYRNLTYKHLFGYKWMAESCNKTEFVLKTDDDQFVDTFHLPRYLTEFARKHDNFFLCQIHNPKPVRNESSKWFVSLEEYGEEEYPLYCAGWAYVTTLPTIAQILQTSKTRPYFWIDDVHVTGVLRNLTQISFYDWGSRFLNRHVQFTKTVLEGKFYTPELMVCGDVTEKQIRHLYMKAKDLYEDKMQAMDWVYKDNKELKSFLPRRIDFKTNRKLLREEL